MRSNHHNRVCAVTMGVVTAVCAVRATADPFASQVIDYAPAPGQLVNQVSLNDPDRALGPPVGGGTLSPNNTSLVTLGGYGGTVTLAFDHTVMDDPTNPLGLDAIVFGNAFWLSGSPNLHWAECGHVEICRDVNGNGWPDEDEPWYLIPGSHIDDPQGQFETQFWDDDVDDPTYPPSNPAWLPPDRSGLWSTDGFRLPPAVFDMPVVVNPNGLNAEDEGVFGYVDYAPTLILGDLDGDNVVDDPGLSPAEFYTVPDDPLVVGVRAGSGGGDAFDIAWAIDPRTGAPAALDGFDFIRITTAAHAVNGALGEMSTEVDAVADVAPGVAGDADADGDVDLADFAAFVSCVTGAGGGAPTGVCRTMDFDGDADVDVGDFGFFQTLFTGPT